MNKKISNETNKDTRVLFGLAFALILIIGGSYAWLSITKTGTKTNVIKAGSLNITLDDKLSNGILLENAVPISDANGLATEAYTFTLENTGSIDASYTIYLDDEPLDNDVVRMQDKFIKYSITKNDGAATTALLTTVGSNPNRAIDTGTISAKSTNNYTLRLWIDSSANNDVMGTVFSGRIRVSASQVTNSNTSDTP